MIVDLVNNVYRFFLQRTGKTNGGLTWLRRTTRRGNVQLVIQQFFTLVVAADLL